MDSLPRLPIRMSFSITLYGQINTLEGVLRVIEQSDGSYISPENEQFFKSEKHMLEEALRLAHAEHDKTRCE
jgi:hypothetical protein